jgi:hypothetical protein
MVANDRLTRAKAEAPERKLAMLDRALVGTGDIFEQTKADGLRIKSKLQAALPRIARNCYYAPNVTEAPFKVRAEFDLPSTQSNRIGFRTVGGPR